MERGQIILLNGPSSSGKTSIANCLQSILPEPFLYLGLDLALNMLPEEFRDWNKPSLIYRALTGLHHCVAQQSGQGLNIILEQVLSEYETSECSFLFSSSPVFFVGVRCSLSELKRREKIRGDRPIGIAESQYITAHIPGVYDLEVDTTNQAPMDVAKLLMASIGERKKSRALETIREQIVAVF